MKTTATTSALAVIVLAMVVVATWRATDDTTPAAHAQQPPRSDAKDKAPARPQDSASLEVKYPVSVGRKAAAKMHQMLDRKLSLEFVDTPLSEVVKVLSDKLGIPVRIDRQSLEGTVISLDSAVTAQLKDVSARVALYWIVRDLGVVYQISDSGIVLTTEHSESSRSLVIYPVADIAKQAIGAPDYDSLIALCTRLVEPDSWDEVGGPGSINGPVKGSLVVRQSLLAHQQIGQLFAALRNPDVTSLESFGLKDEDASQEYLTKALGKTVDLKANGPLIGIVAQLQEMSGAPMVLDRYAMDDEVISSDVDVSIDLENASIETCLREVLAPLGMAYHLHREVVSITTEHAVESDLLIRFYPLRDLLETSIQFDTQDETVYYYSERLDEMVELITSSVGADSWEEVGGPGTVAPNLPRLQLVIAQTLEGHRGIERLLAGIRLASKSNFADDVAGQPRTAALEIRVYDSQGLDPTALVEAIKTHTAPASWAQRPGQSAAETPYILVIRDESELADKNVKRRHRIVVRHSSRIHRQISDLMTRLHWGLWGSHAPPVVGGMF